MKAKITTTEKLVPIMVRLEESTLRDVSMLSNIYCMSRNALINEMLKYQINVINEMLNFRSMSR